MDERGSKIKVDERDENYVNMGKRDGRFKCVYHEGKIDWKERIGMVCKLNVEERTLA